MGLDRTGLFDLKAAGASFDLVDTTASTAVSGLIGYINIVIGGTGWSIAGGAGIVLEESYDNGSTWIVSMTSAGVATAFTTPGVRTGLNSEDGVLHRLRATGAITGGPIPCRLSCGRPQL